MTTTSRPAHAIAWRNAVFVVFALNGLGAATWAIRIPSIRDQLELPVSWVGYLILGVSIGSIVGLVLAVLGLAQHSGELVAGPELMTRGVTGEETGTEVMEGARAEVVAALDAMDPESRTDAAEVQNEVRRALRRHFRRLDRRPVILPFVIEM